jgi:CheY-like chemotaxis protein
VLVVEDNHVNQRIARLQLQELGCRVHVVNNGREALYATMRTDYDLVLMDCAMPLMDGYEATCKIRKQDALTGRHTVIVALTAHAMQGDREKCLSSGMDDYLSKPAGIEQLRETLQRWVNKSVTNI